MTNYRVRDFDFEFDIGDLLEYEGPVAYAPVASVAPRVSFVVINRFDPGSAVAPSTRANIQLRIAHLLAASQRLNMGISVVELVGYADAPGSDPRTVELALKRADGVRARLQSLMNEIAPGSASRVKFSATPNTTGTPALKSCVDVRLPATCQTFWAEYDLQSLLDNDVLGIAANPNINRETRRQQINVIGFELLRRMKARAELALQGRTKPAQPVYPNVTETYEATRALSGMQLALFRKYHRGMTYGFDVGRLAACFQTFSNGQLRSPHPAFPRDAVGEPDTSKFFMFAEFGFLAAESGIDAESWTSALRALVGAQEVYMHVYRRNPAALPPALDKALPATPAVATHPLNFYEAKNFRQVGNTTTRGLGQSDGARLAAVTSKYSKMNLTQLREAARLNLLRAQTFS